MMTLVAQIHSLVNAVCPIYGIRTGLQTDKSTWSIMFDPSATADQQAAGQAVIDNFNLSAWNNNVSIYTQIETLENSITARMMREAQAGDSTVDPNTGNTAAQQIVSINNQIIALRAQLQSL
jgi:hypothetical protein